MDFIRTHLISKIKSSVNEKQKILKFDGFFFLDNPIEDGKKTITEKGFIEFKNRRVGGHRRKRTLFIE